jgi:hypothetical protein
MRLPWYKSNTAIVGTLIIVVLMALKTYASYASIQEQKQTERRIESLSAIKPVQVSDEQADNTSLFHWFDKSHSNEPLIKQAQNILAREHVSERQRKLAQLYINSLKSK